MTGRPTWVHPILQVYMDSTWPDWWTAEQKNRLMAQMIAEPAPEKQQALLRELQQFQWEDMRCVRCGEAFALRAIRQEIVGYENPANWYFWNCGFAV